MTGPFEFCDECGTGEYNMQRVGSVKMCRGCRKEESDGSGNNQTDSRTVRE